MAKGLAKWRNHLRWPGAKTWLQEALVLAALAGSWPLQNYVRQQDAYSFSAELWPLMGLFAATAMVVALGYALALKTRPARLVAGALAVYALLIDFNDRSNWDGGIFNVVLPGQPKLIAAILILVAAGLAGRLVELAAARWRWPEPSTGTMLMLAAAGFVATNVFFAFNYWQGLSRARSWEPQPAAAVTQLTPKAQRDVYYIVLDRYASAESLQQFFSYDNRDFISFLQSEGFTVRDKAYSNYQFTSPSIASTMRMDYHTDLQTDLGSLRSPSYMPYQKILEDSPVSQMFAAAGYDVKRVSSWYGVTRNDHNGQTINPQFEIKLFGQSAFLSDLQEAVLAKTVWASWLKAGLNLGNWQFGFLNDRSTGQLVLDQLQALRDIAGTVREKPAFVFAHILSPHPQFVFTPDGGQPSYDVDDNDRGAPRQLKYTNQLQYLNERVKETILEIKSRSQVQPVIILQADEGPYPPAFADYDQGENGYYPWSKASSAQLKEKYGILAAYYLPDTSAEEQSKLNSSVNTFRFVFNTYFGASLPYLPDCSFLYEGGRPFVFSDVTAKLRGTADDRCQALAAGGVIR